MITWLRRILALALWAVLSVLTLGKVELNRTGEPTADDDARFGARTPWSTPMEDGHSDDAPRAEARSHEPGAPGASEAAEPRAQRPRPR